MKRLLMLSCALLFCSHINLLSGNAQEQPEFMERFKERLSRVRIDAVQYRPAKWETERVHEPENENPNQGGLVHVYFTNSTDRPLGIRQWYLNKEESNHYRMSHRIAWDRLYNDSLQPGQTGVLEINGVSADFAEGAPFEFAFIDRTWLPCAYEKTELKSDDVQISFIRVLPGMNGVELHLRNSGDQPVRFHRAEILGVHVLEDKWTTKEIPGMGQCIVRLTLQEPLSPSQLILARVEMESGEGLRGIFAHRNAFVDEYPIGTWNYRPEHHETLREHHIDTVVQGGSSQDPFFAEHAEKYGLHAMVHTGIYPNVDMIRDLGNHPAVRCWMLHDEPDWSFPPLMMFMSHEMTRKYNQTKPTFITLCRNVKFMEYASIPDIACQDHYSVSAPSSSRWPEVWGTRLEETAYYTQDLKYAAEPKPVWIWTQALASWSEREKMPVPTPDELAAQLVLNMSRGAKGMLWFNMEMNVAEKFPETLQAVQEWGRVLKLLRDDLLASEPSPLPVDAQEMIDATALVGWDKIILCLTNLNYAMREDGYRWNSLRDVKISTHLPEWIKPESVYAVSPQGVRAVEFEVKDKTVEINLDALEVCEVLVIGTENMNKAKRRFEEIVNEEQ